VPEGDAAVGGEISPVGPEIDEELPQIEMTFGAPFASAVAALSPGSWSVPIQSAFGWHLVRVIARADGRPARFEEVRSRVLEQFSVYRRQEAIARYLTGAFGKYRVDVDGKPLKSFVASRRLAYRGVPSGED
jgi:parvulin-like peptidyl-prolyl isomerase